MSIDQGGPKRHALGVDFGTSNTVAVARWPDGRARPILIDGSPLMPSAVYAEPDGQLAVGRDAVHSARIDPARFEPNPKRRIDDGLVLLGERELPVVDLIAGVLARVAEEWHRAVGPVRPEVTLTCPATWGATRRTLLAEAAAMAGLEGARLVAEPVAAATYFAEVLGRDVPIGSVVMVHDFGAGTFDASLVARTGEGFEVLAVDGRDDIGGLDVDAAIVEHLRGDEDEWRRLSEPGTVADRRAQRQLWDDVRIVKERLSRTQSADLVVPLLNTEIHLTRDELEKLARPVLDQTVEVTRSLLRWADLPEGRLAGVFLVGGASRIPLVATLLHRELGVAPVAIEQPELVVAEGSILADAALLASEPAAPGPTAELRLVAARRLERETVRVPVSSLVPTTSRDLAPATPSSAAPAAAAPAPAAAPSAEPAPASSAFSSVAPAPGSSAASAFDARPSSAPAGFGGASTPASRAVDDADTVPERDANGLRPAVDPWPDAATPGPWTPDPGATAIKPQPISAAPPPTAPAGPHRAPEVPARFQSARVTSRPVSPSRPALAPTRTWPEPVSKQAPRSAEKAARPPKQRRADQARADQARPDQPRPAQPRPEQARSAQTRPEQARPPQRRPERRRGGFRRFFSVLFSLVLLIVVPFTAAVIAYGYGNGEPIKTDASRVIDHLLRLFGL